MAKQPTAGKKTSTGMRTPPGHVKPKPVPLPPRPTDHNQRGTND